MISARILATASLLPGKPVSTGEIEARLAPQKPRGWLETKSGIHWRNWSPPGTKMADVAAHAMQQALETAGLRGKDLRRLIFVSSTGGDYLIPATANSIIEKIGADNYCDAFDLNNACMGFLSAFDIAARSVATGLGPVGICAAELGSAFISPENPRPYAIFGDAAAACIVGAGRPGEGICGSFLRNRGKQGHTVTMAHPRFTKGFELVQFTLQSAEMGSLALSLMRECVAQALLEAGEDIAHVDWFLPHQPNGPLFQAFVEAVGIPAEKTVPLVADVGSTASAAIPLSLDRLLHTKTLRPGSRILMAGVGTGISSGAILYRVAD